MRLESKFDRRDACAYAADRGNPLTSADFEHQPGEVRGLRSGANKFFEFGRFEMALGHFHRSLDVALAKIGFADSIEGSPLTRVVNRELRALAVRLLRHSTRARERKLIERCGQMRVFRGEEENPQTWRLAGGGGGIRTHERLSPLPVFKCATIRDAPCLPMPESIIWFGFLTDDMSASTTPTCREATCTRHAS